MKSFSSPQQSQGTLMLYLLCWQWMLYDGHVEVNTGPVFTKLVLLVHLGIFKYYTDLNAESF